MHGSKAAAAAVVELRLANLRSRGVIPLALSVLNDDRLLKFVRLLLLPLEAVLEVLRLLLLEVRVKVVVDVVVQSMIIPLIGGLKCQK